MLKKVCAVAATLAATAMLVAACGETNTGEKKSTSKTGKKQPAQTSPNAPDIEVRDSQATTDESKLADGCNDAAPPYGASAAFTFRLLKQGVADKSDNKEESENQLVSPLSIQLAVNMLANGADDDVWEPLLLSMCMQGLSVEDTNDYSRELTRDLTKVVDGEPEVTIANTLFTRKDVPVGKEIKEGLKHWFSADADFFDPNDSVGTAKKVNTWVSDNTKKRITDLVQPGDFTPLTVLILVNALTFDGDWSMPFENTSTYVDDFKAADGEMEIDFMHGEKTIPFAEHAEGEGGPSFSGGRLEYGKSGRFGMHLIVPTGDTSIQEVVTWFDAARWREWRDATEQNKESILVAIPKMKIEQVLDLTDSLDQLGVPLETYNLFVSDRGNAAAAADVSVSKVKHAVFMKVDEKGTEAAAATSISMDAKAAPREEPELKQLVADRPFLLILDDSEKETVIFAGVINKPEANEND